MIWDYLFPRWIHFKVKDNKSRLTARSLSACMQHLCCLLPFPLYNLHISETCRMWTCPCFVSVPITFQERSILHTFFIKSESGRSKPCPPSFLENTPHRAWAPVQGPQAPHRAQPKAGLLKRRHRKGHIMKKPRSSKCIPFSFELIQKGLKWVVFSADMTWLGFVCMWGRLH